jgi:uncharacterized protein YkwD
MPRLADAAARSGVDLLTMQGWILRSGLAALAALVASVLLAAPALPASGSSRASLATLQTGVLAKLNEIRLQHGLVPLKLNAELSAAATQHTNEMLADGYFAHGSFGGGAFWKRIQHYYPSASFNSWSVGENLLWSGGPVDAATALDLWMNSPEHRANILTARWREIGIAAQYKADAAGAFGGNSVTIVSTDFGART